MLDVVPGTAKCREKNHLVLHDVDGIKRPTRPFEDIEKAHMCGRILCDVKLWLPLRLLFVRAATLAC